VFYVIFVVDLSGKPATPQQILMVNDLTRNIIRNPVATDLQHSPRTTWFSVFYVVFLLGIFFYHLDRDQGGRDCISFHRKQRENQHENS
jgi:hypothetical protein